jgi:hypothetical protein
MSMVYVDLRKLSMLNNLREITDLDHPFPSVVFSNPCARCRVRSDLAGNGDGSGLQTPEKGTVCFFFDFY